MNDSRRVNNQSSKWVKQWAKYLSFFNQVTDNIVQQYHRVWLDAITQQQDMGRYSFLPCLKLICLYLFMNNFVINCMSSCCQPDIWPIIWVVTHYLTTAGNFLPETQIGGSSGMQNWDVTDTSKPQHIKVFCLLSSSKPELNLKCDC